MGHLATTHTPFAIPTHGESPSRAASGVTVSGMSGIAESLREPGSRPFPDQPVGWSNPDMPFEHLVVVMMENHSFDNLLGALSLTRQRVSRADIRGWHGDELESGRVGYAGRRAPHSR